MSGRDRAFTMIEASVVAAVIAIITIMVVPRFAKARDDSRVVATVQDLQDIARTFEYFNSSNGYWPPDTKAGQMPPEMRSFFTGTNPFGRPCPIGGVYDYENLPSDHTIRISILPSAQVPGPTPQDAMALDASLDDGVLETGNFRSIPTGGYTYAFNRK